MVCAAASCRLHTRATSRSGCAIGSTVPRSGQVHTTTSVPSARSRRTARARCATASDGRVREVTSFAPIMIRAMSGCRSRTCSTWETRCSERAPTTAAVTSRTGRSATSASPAASSTPGVSSMSCTPSPAALESPSTASVSSGPAPPPHTPSPTGGRVAGGPTHRRASFASPISSPQPAAVSRPRPPPPYAAAVAIRRARDARLTARDRAGTRAPPRAPPAGSPARA